ncbi:uncharacterized protein LOC109821169 [Asparagus officinalis]|uniref:uncharacterized protein LOC109821169 n=1 Tax=Asparagus officinalis TaxID=4686 RepID=UPI00098E47BE|nr:uncharacterized protein LOC109821169 [Asparagus officinalis]
MDRSWMFVRDRFHNPDFTNGLKTFLNAVKQHLDHENKTCCPCVKCQNALPCLSLPEICKHILVNGFAQNYTTWTEYGEDFVDVADDQMYEDFESDSEDDDDDNAIMLDILNDVQGAISMETDDENDIHVNKYDYLFNEAQRELYLGCTKFSTLSFIIKLMHIKIDGRWSNKSFKNLLKLLNDSYPKGTSIPTSNYEAKNMLLELGLGYESIHACMYDCALFYGKENKKLDECPVCKESRYKSCDGKRKKVPQKVLRYFPLKPRLWWLYMSRHTATKMKWHKRRRQNEEGFLRHPANSAEWKHFDQEYPDFAADY